MTTHNDNSLDYKQPIISPDNGACHEWHENSHSFIWCVVRLHHRHVTDNNRRGSQSHYYGLQFSQDQPCSACKTTNSHSSSNYNARSYYCFYSFFLSFFLCQRKSCFWGTKHTQKFMKLCTIFKGHGNWSPCLGQRRQMVWKRSKRIDLYLIGMTVFD